jgi:hypothetical protein
VRQDHGLGDLAPLRIDGAPQSLARRHGFAQHHRSGHVGVGGVVDGLLSLGDPHRRSDCVPFGIFLARLATHSATAESTGQARSRRNSKSPVTAA